MSRLIVATVAISYATAFVAHPTPLVPSSTSFAADMAPRHAAAIASGLQQSGAVVDCGCEEEDSSILMNDVRVSGATLRGMELADASGARVLSGSYMGDPEGQAVVVFLRHMG